MQWDTRLDFVHQPGVVALTLATSTMCYMPLCALSVDACIPFQWNIIKFSQAFSQLHHLGVQKCINRINFASLFLGLLYRKPILKVYIVKATV